MQRTLVILKPDAVQRGLIGEITKRFEQRGLHIVAIKMLQMDQELAQRHYAEHEGKPFYPELIEYITSAPVVVMVLEGRQAVSVVRQMMGSTDPVAAAPGTIRADYALQTGRNLVHGSDGPEAAHREVELFFGPTELLTWKRDIESWIMA